MILISQCNFNVTRGSLNSSTIKKQWYLQSSNLYKSKYKKVGVLPIRIVLSNVSRFGPSSERKGQYSKCQTIVTIRIGSTPIFLYFDLYLYYVYYLIYIYLCVEEIWLPTLEDKIRITARINQITYMYIFVQYDIIYTHFKRRLSN